MGFSDMAYRYYADATAEMRSLCDKGEPGDVTLAV